MLDAQTTSLAHPSIDTLASYVPKLVIGRRLAAGEPLVAPEEQLFEAAAMLADVSGFTKLAEKLAQRGPAGAEELTGLLSAYFDPLIACIHSHGGDVLKFAGDALLVVFPANGDPTAAALAAASCGLALQERSAAHPARDGVKLGLKVGLGVGEMRLAHLGGRGGHWEVMVTGPPLVELGRHSGAMQPGEVFLVPSAFELVRDASVCTEQADGCAVLARLDVAADSTSSALPVDFPESAEALIKGYVPVSVLSRLAARQTGWLSESRPISVLFLNFPNATHATTLERANMVFSLLQATFDRYEGTINKISVDDKGVSVVAAFGLPGMSHEDDAARAVLAAMDLQVPLLANDVRHSIGITTGRAYCGIVGGASRREYTVMGDMVNLAARLMQAGKDEVLCDEATEAKAAWRVTFGPLPPLSVKGKALPVAVFRPMAAKKRERHFLSDMIGRDVERTLVKEALAQLAGGEAAAIVLEGEAGIGKSRLLQFLANLAEDNDLAPLIGSVEFVDRSTPFNAWRQVFAGMLGIEAHDNPRERAERILSVLADDPPSLDLAPLLASILAADIPDNAVTRHLEGSLRAENTRDLLLRILASHAKRAPVLAILDDAQWLDSASWGLVLAALAEVRPMLLVVALRPPGDPVVPEYRQLIAGPTCRRLALGALSAPEAVAVACRRLGAESLPDTVAALVAERSDGHPFFAEQLAFGLRDGGFIQVQDGKCDIVAGSGPLSAAILPQTVQGLISSRLDRLAPPEQLTLKVASVIGRSFDLRVLRDIYPILADRPHLADHLSRLADLDLIRIASPEPDLSFEFIQTLTQEVAYDLLLFAQRKDIHRAVAHWHEAREDASVPLPYAILAHHWSLAGDGPRTLACLDKAAASALQGGAYQEAIEFIKDAQRMAEGVPGVLQQARREKMLGEAALSLGRLPESRARLESAVGLLGWRLPPMGPRWAAGLLGHVARQIAHRRRPPVPLFGAERDLRLEAASAFERLGQVLFFLNEPLNVLYCSLAGVNLAEEAGPSPELAKNYANLAIGTSLVPMHALALRYEALAEEAAAKIDDLPAIAWVQEIVGLLNAGLGRWVKVAPALERALAITELLGDHRRFEECQMVAMTSGWAADRYEEALAPAQQANASARRRGDLQMVAGTLFVQGHSLLRLSRVEEALPLLAEGVELARKGDWPPERIATCGAYSAALLEQGDKAGALLHAEEAAKVAAGAMPTASYMFEGYAAAADTLVRLLAEDPRAPGLKAMAKKASKALDAFARTFPMARARAQSVQDRL